MPTEAPPAPKGPEIDILNTPPQNAPATMPDSLLAEARKLAGETVEDPPPPPPKTDKTPPPSPAAAKPPEKAPEKPAKADPEPPKKKEGIEAIREALARQTAKAEELAASVTATAKEKELAFAKAADLEAKVAKYEERISKDLEPRLAVLTEKEKRLQQAEEQLRVRDYMATPEFHDKYVKPIVETQTEVKELLSELTVKNTEGQEVPANSEHFNYVIAAPNQTEAGRRAEELFGPHVGGTIANYRLKLKTLENRRQEASKNAALESIEYEKQRQAQSATAREQLLHAVTERENKYVSEFRPPEEDAELVTAFSQGKQFADELAQATPDMGPEKFADTIARARAAIQKAPVLQKKVERLTAKVAELEAQLKEYQASEPDVRGRNGSGPKGGDDDEGGGVKSKLLKAATELATSY